MSVEVLKEEIELPAQNNLTWIFKVRLNGRVLLPWKVDSFDLNMWFREAVGRYPRHDRGDKDELEDIREHWDQVEPRLRSEAEKEAQLGVRIGVDGMRTSSGEWSEAQSIPSQELPPLNDSQREAAKKLGVSEEDYARSFVAGEKTADSLLVRTERLASILREYAKHVNPEAKLDSVMLRTWEERFDAEFLLAGRRVPVRIREGVVNDLFEAGSERAEESLQRILRIALRQQAVQ